VTSTRLSLGPVVAQCPLCIFPQGEHRHDHEHNSHGLMGQCVCPEHCNEEQFTREMLCSIAGDSGLFLDPLPEMLETLIFSYAYWHGGRDVRLRSNHHTHVDPSRVHLLLWRGLVPYADIQIEDVLAPAAETLQTTPFKSEHEQSGYRWLQPQPFEGPYRVVDEVVGRTPPPAEWAYHYKRSQDAMQEHRQVRRDPSSLVLVFEMTHAMEKGHNDDRGVEVCTSEMPCVLDRGHNEHGWSDDRGVETCIPSNCLEGKTWFPARTYNRTAKGYTLGKSSRKDRTAWAQKLDMRTEPVSVLLPVLKPTIDRLYGDSLPNPHRIEALRYWCRELHRKGLRNKHLLASLPHKSNGHLTRAALKYLETEFVYTKSRRKLSKGKLFRAERETKHVYTSARVQNWGPSGKPNKHAVARLRREIAKSTPISERGQAQTSQGSL
jgi:hypothetical protein